MVTIANVGTFFSQLFCWMAAVAAFAWLAVFVIRYTKDLLRVANSDEDPVDPP